MQDYIQFVQQHMLLSLAWVGILIALILNVFKSSTAKFKSISINEVTYLINKEDGIVVDIRSREDFRRGHITDSYNLSASEIKNGSFGAIENKKSAPIIVVCATGQSAQEAAGNLIKAGYEKVSILKNGLQAWNDANLPLVRGKKTKEQTKEKN